MRFVVWSSTLCFLGIVSCSGQEPAVLDRDKAGSDGGATAPPPASRGYTRCGETMCIPGQYCEDMDLRICKTGCLSDDNCALNQRCNTTTRTCEGAAAPADARAGCEAACDHFQSCGLAAADVSECRVACGQLGAAEQQAVAGCAERSCATAPACIGRACFDDRHCDGGECLAGNCL